MLSDSEKALFVQCAEYRKALQQIDLNVSEIAICLDRESPNVEMAINRLREIMDSLRSVKVNKWIDYPKE